MAEYTLHCFAQSGNAYKAALMLELCGADWRPAFVDYFAGATREPAFAELNEMAEIPVLEHRSRRLTQSGVILDYLGKKLGRFRPEGAEAKREVLRWLLWDNHKLTASIATYRFLVTFVPPDKRSADVIAFVKGRMDTALGILERHLAPRDWILGAAPTIVDLSCIGYFYYGDEWGLDRARYPAIAAWTDRIRALPRWKHPYDLMPGHPLPARS
ncbi:MAG TPA: glutathione S-transferase [Paracoccaceae bacterium]|nr:glutathione S-transferase [Paracoccaceae bacterium]